MSGDDDFIIVRSSSSEKKLPPRRILITKLAQEGESLSPKVGSRKIQRHQFSSERFEGF